MMGTIDTLGGICLIICGILSLFGYGFLVTIVGIFIIIVGVFLLLSGISLFINRFVEQNDENNEQNK